MSEIFKIIKLNYDLRLKEINQIIDKIDIIEINDVIDNSDRKIKFQNNFEELWEDENIRLINLEKKVKFDYLNSGLDKNYLKLKYSQNFYAQYNKNDIFEIFMSSFLYYLDPHTKYLNYNIFGSNKKSGIGISIEQINNEFIIKNIIKNGPAF